MYIFYILYYNSLIKQQYDKPENNITKDIGKQIV